MSPIFSHILRLLDLGMRQSGSYLRGSNKVCLHTIIFTFLVHHQFDAEASIGERRDLFGFKRHIVDVKVGLGVHHDGKEELNCYPRLQGWREELSPRAQGSYLKVASWLHSNERCTHGFRCVALGPFGAHGQRKNMVCPNRSASNSRLKPQIASSRI